MRDTVEMTEGVRLLGELTRQVLLKVDKLEDAVVRFESAVPNEQASPSPAGPVSSPLPPGSSG